MYHQELHLVLQKKTVAEVGVAEFVHPQPLSCWEAYVQ